MHNRVKANTLWHGFFLHTIRFLLEHDFLFYNNYAKYKEEAGILK